ncbi:MAG: sigma-70 family RNA polymerase sigma factor [Hyphomicrobiales bacterium]|nr:sigma-70 family RNA polymerase sigma factor [Hyphomicrobiales bacterium]MDE2017664.1 sigma-70 family RNA polymerase sigma factor [Hyphomicrobiales bacterium]
MTLEEAERFRRLAVPAMSGLHRFARSLTRDRSSADDLLQGTYLRAISHFSGYAGGDMRAWLVAIMRNLHRSGGGRGVDVPLDEAPEPVDPAPGPEREVVATDEFAALRAALDRLPREQAEALRLREFAGLDYAGIAAAQGVPVGTVMSRLARARATLRKDLAP